jgi:hypothetical protein
VDGAASVGESHLMKRLLWAVVLVASLGLAPGGRADDPPKSPGPQEPAVNQEILAQQFQDFERSLLRLAQRLERSSKPEDRERAATLKKAIALASGKGTDNKFDRLIKILRGSKSLSLQEIKEAMEQNRMVAEDVKAILALLLADNRDDELRREKERLERLLKDLQKVIREQKMVRTQTESGRMDKAPLGKAQDKVTEKTADLRRAMESKDGKSEGKGDGKAGGQQPPDGDKKDADKGAKGKDQQAKQEEQSGTPGRKQVQEANDLQKKAREDIDKDKRNDASGKQDKAINKLEQVEQQLKELLRQLREEERERLLAALQQRCERMLQMQIEVQEGTVRVARGADENPDHHPNRVQEQRALQLSDREEAIVREADKAIQLLQAEGSAVAFPEVFLQVREDMRNAARRLGKADVGPVTQVIEQDIINTLKEMIEALKKAQSKGGGGGGGGGGQQQEQALIELLSELKMIRAMQARVYTRTRVYGERYQGEQAAEPDIQKELLDLAQRQMRIFEVTDNLYRGRNR